MAAAAVSLQRPEASLEERAAEAQTAEQPLAERVSELEGRLADAVARSAYHDAEKIKTTLEPARLELAIARANREALESALGAIAAQRAADTRAIQQQRARDQAHATIATAQAGERAALEDLQQHAAAITAGLAAVRQSIGAGLAAEQRAGQHRQDAHTALVELGERQPMRILAPNDVSAMVERDVVLRAVWTGQV